MLKMAKEAEDLSLKESPQTIKDPVRWNRLKVMVFEEAIDRAWGCPLYILNRIGWLTNEQREAGDKYQQITLDYNQSQQTDPDELMPEAQELAYKRIARRKTKWKDCVNALGIGRKIVDSVVLREEHPITDRERHVLRDGLQLLANLFSTGRTKRQRNVV